MTTSDGAHRFGSWSDLPPEVRDLIASRLPDTHGDGIPDLLRGLMDGSGTVPPPDATSQRAQHTQRRSVDVDGKSYESVAAMPAEIRARVLSAIKAAVVDLRDEEAAATGGSGVRTTTSTSFSSGWTTDGMTPAATAAPRAAATTDPASPRAGTAAPGEMILNGDRVPDRRAGNQAGATPGLLDDRPRRSWWARLLGR